MLSQGMIRWIALTMSAAAHGGLLVWAVLALAGTPFAPVPEQAIMIDLVPEDLSRLFGKAPQHPPGQAPAPRAESRSAAKPEAGPKPPEQPAQQPQRGAPASEPRADPSTPAQASDTPQLPLQALAMLDPASVPTLFNQTAVALEPPAETAADLQAKDVAAFRAQLRKCWRMPAGVGRTSTARVVLRVGFTPDGALRGEPVLLEASASREGPAVMQAALRALRDCAPYAALPAERYGEWKVLDLTFTPRELGGS